MNKNFFALLIACTISISPLSANEHSEIQKNTYNKGFTKGMLTTLSSSMAALGLYLFATGQNGFYIPEHIFRQTGYRTLLRRHSFRGPSHIGGMSSHYETEPVYTRYDNDLYTMMQDPETMISNNGVQKSSSVLQESDFLQKINENKFSAASGALLISAAALALYLYYTTPAPADLDDKVEKEISPTT